MVYENFKWMNESEIDIEEDKIAILAIKGGDFFCNGGSESEEGITPATVASAPYFYTEVSGDFVFRAKISLEFKDVFDSGVLMVMVDDANWAKACFERTEFNTNAVVSVVTKNADSDDANGCNIEGDSVWLQIARVDNAFSFHYSIDGENFYMMRFFTLPVKDSLKLGFAAQAPQGDGGWRVFEQISLKNKTVKNIRAGK